MTGIAAIYCRLSPRPDDQYAGVDVQERLGREYAARVWPGMPVKVYRDKGISASNGDTLPELDALRADIQAGMVGHLWAVEQSRLERREAEWFTLAAELDGAGIAALHTHRDGVVDVRSAMAGIKAVLNAEEIRKMKRRINDRLADNAAQGLPAGSPRMGYRQALNDEGERTFEIVESEATLIRESAERLLDGWSLTAIALDIQARGIDGPRGGRIQPRHVHLWLTSPTVAGFRVHRGENVGKGNWPAILDEDIWRRTCAKLATRSTGPSTGRKYLLTGGVAICGKCGAPMRGAPRKMSGGYAPYLHCPPPVRGGQRCTGIRMLDAEKVVLDALWAELDKPQFLTFLEADEYDRQRGEISSKLAALDTRRKELAEMWSRGELNGDEWAAARAGLATQEQQLREDLAAFPAAPVTADIGQAREAWPHMTLDEQREFLSAFVSHVKILTGRRPAADRVAIEWRTR